MFLENGEIEVEDATWLKKKDDFNYINDTELDAVLEGVNLALRWSCVTSNSTQIQLFFLVG